MMIYRSHRGRGPHFAELVQMDDHCVLLRLLNRRNGAEFSLPRKFLDAPQCGWVLYEVTGKG